MDYETVNTGEENIDVEDVGEDSSQEDTGDSEKVTQNETETRKEREAREEREAQERERRAKKRRLIPPFVMLLAGAITSITMRILHYETKTMLIILLCVLIGFYIAGSLLKYMLDKFEKQIEEAYMEEGEVIEKELAEEDRLTVNSEAIEKDE
ncbi:MAG: hypothetical protein J1F18_04765 [Lachnospiraceae bacterium]|nr:hypothetical protein [Lachnospiraceae bacterium]